MPLKEALALNNFCHRHGIAFIRADIRGVFASVFTDFGPKFAVVDVDGAFSRPFIHVAGCCIYMMAA